MQILWLSNLMTSMTLLICNACYSWKIFGVTDLLWCSYESRQAINLIKMMVMYRNGGWVFRWCKLLMKMEIGWPWLRLRPKQLFVKTSLFVYVLFCFNFRAKVLDTSYSWNKSIFHSFWQVVRADIVHWFWHSDGSGHASSWDLLLQTCLERI